MFKFTPPALQANHETLTKNNNSTANKSLYESSTETFLRKANTLVKTAEGQLVGWFK